jgi:hypothetical protein
MEGTREKRTPDGVLKLGERIDLWRRTRAKPGAMPEALWQAAAKLARKHGVNRVAAPLRLEYYSLKRRVDEAELVGRRQPARRRPTFVEVPRIAEAPSGNVLEIERPGGTKVTLRLSSAVDVVGVLESVWRAER